MKRVMLDLETLSTKPNAVIASVGAVVFDPETGEAQGDPFYETMGRGDQVEQLGRHISLSTVDWWMKQNDAAREVFSVPSYGPEYVAAHFQSFMDRNGYPELWCYGANFDEPVLGSLFDDIGQKRPWTYRQVRCHRTLLSLGTALGVTIPPRAGTHHNALDDAIYQAQCAVLILNKMGVK